mgnify:FL=1
MYLKTVGKLSKSIIRKINSHIKKDPSMIKANISRNISNSTKANVRVANPASMDDITGKKKKI